MGNDDPMEGQESGGAPPGSPPISSRAEAGRSADRQIWQCPYCDHRLSYRPQDRDVAEMAANSHVVRQHKVAGSIVIPPEP